MEGAEFLSDKFLPAPLPDVCAPRRALIGRFHQAAQRRLVFVSAPAGFGKTVSTILWLNDAGRKAAWIGLDGYDNSLAIFYKLLCQGLLSLQPHNGNMRRILRSESFASSPVEHAIRLIAEFEADGARCALVLDDMHLITNGEILKSLPFLFKRLPHVFVTLVLSRNEPDREFMPLIEAEKAMSVTAADLLFSQDEIGKYFLSLGRQLNADEAAAAHAATGGWAIGVNALAQGGPLQTGQGGARILDRYIRKQIWDMWDEPLRDFILKTSVAEEMPVDLCVLLTGRADSGTVLNRLRSANAFVSKLSEDTYRYHHLFYEFARAMRADTPSIDEPALYKICARYYAERREHFLSLRCWLKSGDYKGIGPYFYSYVFDRRNRAMTENIAYFEAFFTDFPEEAFREYPALRISRVWYAYVTGDHAGMEAHLDALYRSVPAMALKTPEYMEYVALAYSVDHRVDFPAQVRRFQWIGRFIRNFSNGLVTKSIVSFAHNLPYMHRSNRDYCDLSREGDDFRGKLGATFGKVLGTEWAYVAPGCWAGFAYEKNDPERALSLALESDARFSPAVNSVEGLFCVKIILNSAYSALGRAQEAEDTLRELEELVAREPYLIPNFTAYKTRYALWSGDRAAARAWLEQYFVTEAGCIQLHKIFQHFVTARAYIALSDADRAFEQLARIRRFAAAYRRPTDLAEAGALQAALEWALGRKKEAQATLETALCGMQPYGFVRVIADEGADVLPILKRIAAQVRRAEYAGALDSRYVTSVYLAAYEQSKRRKGIACGINAKPVRLSKQQALMLTLLARGYKNAQIVEETGLTINTVKAHTRVAYEKLSVNNVADAVGKARELGLIK